MKKINLQQYNTSSQNFYFFDALFKEKGIHKENYLMDNYITPSSYRRARAKEQSVGYEIIKHLCELFDYNITPTEVVNKLEKVATRIYNSMNYKIFTTYNDDLEYLESIIDKKYLITPIIELLILFLKINSPQDPKYTILGNMDLFKKIKTYKIFYNEDLLIIYELITLYFGNEKDEDARIKKYNNAMAYFILASQSFRNGKYVEALYYSSKSKEICEEEGNIKRIISLNNIIMSSLLYVGNYEECYELANKQMLILEAAEAEKFEFKFTTKFLAVSAIGVKDYETIINIVSKEEAYNLTCIFCLIIAMYNIYKKEFNNVLADTIDFDSFDDESIKSFELLKKFLLKKDKTYLNYIQNEQIMPPLLKILKKTTA